VGGGSWTEAAAAAVLNRLGADADGPRFLACLRLLATASGRPVIRLAFSTSDHLGAPPLLRARIPLPWRDQPTAGAPDIATASRLVRRLDRACGLAVPWSRYDALLATLLDATPPVAGAAATSVHHEVTLAIELRFDAPGRTTLQVTTEGVAWGADEGRERALRLARLVLPPSGAEAVPALLADRALTGVSVRLGQQPGLSLHLSGTDAPGSTTGGLLANAQPALEPVQEIRSWLRPPGAQGGGTVAWSISIPESPELDCSISATITSAEQLHAPDAIDRLLHRLRAHLVGFRTCEDLLGDAPTGVTVTISARTAPVVTIEARPTAVSGPGPPRRADHDGPAAVSVRRAVEYLLGTQSPGGGWWDLAVSAGASGPWLTAVVGLALTRAQVADLHGVPLARQRAAAYLRTAELPHGWGWNEALEPDCDSTAHAVLFLRHAEGDVPSRSIAALMNFQAPSGAFLTYRGAPVGHSWGLVHHDVHPAAVRALGAVRGRDDSAVRAGLPTVWDGLRHDPPWPAFWWTKTIYGAYVAVTCLSEVGRLDLVPAADRWRLLALLKAADPLETALGCSIACLLEGRPPGPFVDRLISTQHGDGSWDAAPSLRVVDPGCAEPWRPELTATAGTVYPESRRIFTTAMAITALTSEGSMS
jgi:hypothetical protein